MKNNKYDEIFQQHAKGTPFSWLQYKAQGIAESNLNPVAVSSAGAIGIMQIMPNTGWKDLNLMPADLRDPKKNIAGGITYMQNMHTFWKAFPIPETEMWFFCLASYNAGIGNMSKAFQMARDRNYEANDWSVVAALTLPDFTGRHSVETINYVARCKRFYRELEQRVQIDGGAGEGHSPAAQAGRQL